MSERGIQAVRSAGHDELLAKILDSTIPMYGRMVHTTSGSQAQAYDVHGRYQRSVDRNAMNKLLLNKLDTMPNVQIHFRHKLMGVDLRAKKAWFEDRNAASTSSDHDERPPEFEVTFDLLIGADGAHSAVRHHMMKFTRMDYSQTYIDSLWCEFTMTPAANHASVPTHVSTHKLSPSDTGYRIPVNYLHIWPAGTSMFIALPSPGGFFVCTLFGPAELFSRLEASTSPSSPEFDDGKTLVEIFDQLFPGVSGHIPPASLIEQFKRNPHLPLVNIKASPHHCSDSAVIVGDSANAIVPFYGQGMNAGLESVRILWEAIDQAKEDSEGWHGWMADGLERYSRARTEDTHAIADLALGNYHEMAAGVVSRSYKVRKWIEEFMYAHAPRLGWQTQYSRVSFSNERYSEVIKKSQRQKKILTAILNLTATGFVGVVAYFVYHFTGMGRRLGR